MVCVQTNYRLPSPSRTYYYLTLSFYWYVKRTLRSGHSASVSIYVLPHMVAWLIED